MQVLQTGLELGGYMPKREYTTEEEFKKHWPPWQWQEEGEIIVDATEQWRQRPGNQEKQKDAYSGQCGPAKENDTP
ncbi:hypothetical protein [Chondrinema litorale]|uniref:hypothetical protein n=1 Tax=Chondrinema litorale TaxID=2994555 RepID=UPI002542B926|nr:hypothetical protein [Chondrinema litorale]UZR99952.1 hypothetical protein OQ292_39365 [Chondrinema litorale]